jgi:hypothetical protein
MYQKKSLKSRSSRIVALNQLIIHPCLEPVIQAFSGEFSGHLSSLTLVRATTCAIDTQVYTTIKIGSDVFLTGPLIACLPIAQGIAVVSEIHCVTDQVIDAEHISTRAWNEAILILGTLPQPQQAEQHIAKIILAMPESLRIKALALRGRSTTELANLLNTTRYKLKPPRQVLSDDNGNPLGFSLAALKNKIGTVL